MSIDYYRKFWVTDMANRTVDGPWNIYSPQQWMEGWKQMLTPGIYERGIFGDLMLPGISCGVRKFLLIFNTNLETPHDPIYVVDPRNFGVNPDTEIPVVLSYNLSHYESIHPLNENDIQATVDLVKEYLGGKYRFRRKDLPYLLGLDMKLSHVDIQLKEDRLKPNASKTFEHNDSSALSKGTSQFDKIQLSTKSSKEPVKRTRQDESNFDTKDDDFEETPPQKRKKVM